MKPQGASAKTSTTASRWYRDRAAAASRAAPKTFMSLAETLPRGSDSSDSTWDARASTWPPEAVAALVRTRLAGQRARAAATVIEQAAVLASGERSHRGRRTWQLSGVTTTGANAGAAAVPGAGIDARGTTTSRGSASAMPRSACRRRLRARRTCCAHCATHDGNVSRAQPSRDRHGAPEPATEDPRARLAGAKTGVEIGE